VIIFSYNLSPTLTSLLNKIEKTKNQILILPLSISLQNQLVWQTTLSHLSGWTSLSNQPLTHDALTSLLTGPGANRQLTPFEKKAIDYRTALNHLWIDWTANPKSIATPDLKKLADILGVSFKKEEEVTSLLGYIQTGSVHPLVQSAIVHLYFYPSRLSYLSSLLIMYKHGFDFKRMISLEEFWSTHKDEYLKILTDATKLGNVTLWLEYYCTAILSQLETLQKTIHTLSQTPTPPTYQLSLRQKQILSLAEPPNTLVSNKLVQDTFRISQITASRDLAKLASLGLLIPHGHGRSTSYSKA
jgi:hypothetical protein